MSEDDGQGHPQVALHHMQVAMTHAGGIHADLDFPALGRQHLDLFETEGRPDFIEHGGLCSHRSCLLSLHVFQEDWSS
jgi:hypothetical protein